MSWRRPPPTANGAYSFSATPGTYTVGFEPPASYAITQQESGSDPAVDSNPEPGTGKTDPITLTSGQSDLTQDAGLYRPVSLGDRVWEDLNGDGIQQASEPGLTRCIREAL